MTALIVKPYSWHHTASDERERELKGIEMRINLNAVDGSYIRSAMIVERADSALRDIYLDALASAGVGEDGHGEAFTALALDLIDSGYGTRSDQYRALVSAFDTVCKFDATAQPLALS